MEHDTGVIVDLTTEKSELWSQVFLVAPLILVGTREADGTIDLAPKHQAMPLGWDDDYGFICTAKHRTHANVQRTGEFTVSYPSPDQAVAIGQAAAPRINDEKYGLAMLQTRAAGVVDAPLVEEASLWLECRLERIITGFGEHDLIAGKVVAASAPHWNVRSPDVDDADLIARHPLLTYLSPDRFAAVTKSYSFPFPAGFMR